MFLADAVSVADGLGMAERSAVTVDGSDAEWLVGSNGALGAVNVGMDVAGPRRPRGLTPTITPVASEEPVRARDVTVDGGPLGQGGGQGADERRVLGVPARCHAQDPGMAATAAAPERVESDEVVYVPRHQDATLGCSRFQDVGVRLRPEVGSGRHGLGVDGPREELLGDHGREVLAKQEAGAHDRRPLRRSHAVSAVPSASSASRTIRSTSSG